VRITTQQIFDNMLLGIRQQQQIQADGAAQVSSGHRFTRPSDDALGFKKSVDIRHVQAGIKSSLSGLSTATSRLGASSNALSQMLPLLQRAQALAVQQSNATLGSSERQAAAAEVTTLQDQLLALANQTFEGESLFAGTATSTDAFNTAFNAGVASYTQGMNTTINVTQTANPNAVNDTYTITLDDNAGAGPQRVTSIIASSTGAEMLPGGPPPTPISLSPGSNALDISANGNGVILDAFFTGPVQMSTDGGKLDVTGANATGNINYVGNAQDRVAAITSAQTVISNVRGDETAFTQAFSSIKALKDALTANDAAGVQTALGQLNAAGDAMTELTAKTGGRLSAVTSREQVFQDLQVQMEQRRGQIEDADLATVAASLARSQVALQASFSEMARIGTLSLVQFLR